MEGKTVILTFGLLSPHKGIEHVIDALLDLETAEHCLLRGDSWIFGPETPYEREGDVGYVTFPCGYTLGADGDAINLYYGAADTSIALATGSVSQLLAWLDRHGTTT